VALIYEVEHFFPEHSAIDRYGTESDEEADPMRTASMLSAHQETRPATSSRPL
jgi:hypothetical protein